MRGSTYLTTHNSKAVIMFLPSSNLVQCSTFLNPAYAQLELHRQIWSLYLLEHKITWSGNLTQTKTSQLWQNCPFLHLNLDRFRPVTLSPWFHIIPLQYHLYNIHNGPIQFVCWQPSWLNTVALPLLQQHHIVFTLHLLWVSYRGNGKPIILPLHCRYVVAATKRERKEGG